MSETTRIGIPAIDNDPSLRAIAQVADERFSALPVKEVLVWRVTEDSNADALKHIASALGLGDLSLDFGVGADPLPVLRGGIYQKRRRGSKGVILKALEGAGIAPDQVTFLIGESWHHDGTITYSGTGEYTHGSDAHWAIVVTRVEVGAPLTLAQTQAVWSALDGSKSQRDHVTLVVRNGSTLYGVYRAFPEVL